ncbi:ABC transporter permease (plasmid) [Mesorhizobium sp. ORM8.1]
MQTTETMGSFRPGLLYRSWRRIATAPISALFGLVVVTLLLLTAIFANFVAPYGEGQVVSDAAFDPWGAKYLLGTDQLGRDMLSRLIYGTRNSVVIALVTTVMALGLGATLGMLAAVVKGWFDQVLSRAVDVLISIPQLIFALVLLSISGPSTLNMILIIAALDSTRFFRLGRAVTMNVVELEFFEAAQLRGEPLWRLLFQEVLPNISAPLVAEFGVRFCFVLLTISGLSFLGLGVQPPLADWGSMVRENAILIGYGDVTPLVPAGAIALLVVSVNFVVDWQLQLASGLRDDV